MPSAVDHPPHYNQHPSGVEAVDVCEHLSFNLGNALKYVWRLGLKPGQPMRQELEKARWYLDREGRLLNTDEDEQRRRFQANVGLVVRADERLLTRVLRSLRDHDWSEITEAHMLVEEVIQGAA